MENHLSPEESKELKKLENSLNYGRGILVSQWPRLEELRSKYLLSQGLDPKDWTLDARTLGRKNK